MERRRSMLGQRIEHEMVRKGLVQAELAHRLNVSQQTVSKWLTGETTPRPKAVVRLEEVLGLTPGTLAPLVFGLPTTPQGDGNRSSTPARGKRDRRLALAALNQQLGDLDEHELSRVQAYVAGIFDARR